MQLTSLRALQLTEQGIGAQRRDGEERRVRIPAGVTGRGLHLFMS